MIRIIVVTTDACRAANVGGPVEVSYRTFDIAAPEVEAFMAERHDWKNTGSLADRTIVGIELLDDSTSPSPA